MKYRRAYIPGGSYFFTLVTYQRRPVFSTPESVDLLRNAFRYTIERLPFKIIASVILPDHIHIIWELPSDSGDYSTRWRLIKSHFTRHWKEKETVNISVSRQGKGESGVWQRRFWEHYLRDEDDLARHIEYIHFNPVKHGLVDSPAKWNYSSFSSFVRDGYYPSNWGEDGRVWPGEGQME
jgi:putative transposase